MSKAKSKPNRKRPAPRRVWGIENAHGFVLSYRAFKCNAVRYVKECTVFPPYRLIEFIEVQPKRKARGK